MHLPRTAQVNKGGRLWQYGLGAVAAVALFVATGWWPDTPDGLIHLQRTRALAEALQMGVLFPRLFPDFAFGYGFPVFNFYAPLFYYPPALLHVLGVDLLIAVRLALALGFGASALGMLALVRQWGGSSAALVATIFFLLFPYRLYDLFVRGALPEFAAFVWLPWLALTTTAMLRAAWQRQPDEQGITTHWAIWSALAWAALLLTHNLTALLVALAGVGIALLLLLSAATKGQLRRSGAPLLWSLLAFGAGSLLAGWYVLPALLEARWVAIGAQETQGYLNHFATWETLLSWRFPYLYPTAAEPVVPLPGVVALLAVVALLLFWSKRPAQPRRLVLAVWATLVSAIFLSTLWSEPVWRLLAPLLSRLQFPWRWQAIVGLAAALLLAFLVQWGVRHLAERRAHLLARTITVALAALILALFVGGLRWNVLPAQALDLSRAAMLRFDADMGQVGATWTAEFLPIWVTEQRWAIGREPSAAEDTPVEPVQATATLRRAGYLFAEYAVTAPAAWQATFHRFHYPAWRVGADGARLESAPVTSLGLVRASVAAGAHTLRLAWAATTAVWLGRVATLGGWLVVLMLLLRVQKGYGKQSRKGLLAVALWLGVALFGLLAASGVTARAYPVQPQDADFGVVQLAGVVAPDARRGASAPVTLHWLVREGGRELTVFIHLLNANGEVMAQQDTPLGGAYTPGSRLLSGQLLDPTYQIPLPADLPAGAYQLRIGVYPAGSPQAPLAVAGSDQPFVTAAWLEVRP